RRSMGVRALEPNQRIRVAARIAAMTVLCGKPDVWLGLEHERPTDDAHLSIGEISSDSEVIEGASLVASDDAIREVVGDTRLFVPIGANRFGWVHRIYAEFLAAQYLTNREVPIEQLKSMLCHPELGRIVPQLRGVAAWLASRLEILQFVQKADPEVLFSVD